MWDAKGGGGGGGGGSIAIHALGTITITDTGAIIAKGGRGGGGEQVGVSNFGGAGGGGSGGVVILHSGERIVLQEGVLPEDDSATIDVSGGMMGEAKATVALATNNNYDPCPYDNNPKTGFCTLSNGDGGQGGFGIIQLMVDDPDNDISPAPDTIYQANVKVYARVFSAEYDGNKENYTRNYITYEPGSSAYPKTFNWGETETFDVPLPPLVDPHVTVATLSPLSYGTSKWLDLGGATLRPELPAESPHRRSSPSKGPIRTEWVITENGYVKNYQITDLNDIEVDAPNLGISDYIPAENEVTVEFQGGSAGHRGVEPARSGSQCVDERPQQPFRVFVHPFRVILNVAKSGELNLTNTRPQVNKVRIRVQY